MAMAKQLPNGKVLIKTSRGRYFIEKHEALELYADLHIIYMSECLGKDPTEHNKERK